MSLDYHGNETWDKVEYRAMLARGKAALAEQEERNREWRKSLPVKQSPDWFKPVVGYGYSEEVGDYVQNVSERSFTRACGRYMFSQMGIWDKCEKCGKNYHKNTTHNC
jgi:hypothetical protein